MADKIRVEIDIDQGGEIKFRKLTDAAEEFGERGQKSLDKFSVAFQTMAGFVGGAAIVGAFKQVVGAASDFFQLLVVDGVRAAQETEDNIVRLNQSLAASGKFTQAASDSLVAYSEELQRTTKFSNDQVLRTEALISTFGRLGEKELKVATKAALDLSTAFGIDLESATRMVGKAAEGESNAFAKLKIRFAEGSTSAQTFANAMEALNARGIGGASEAQVNTYSGAVAVAGHAFEDFTKEVGNSLIKNVSLISLIKASAETFDRMSVAIVANKDTINQWISGSILVATESIASLVRALAKVESVVAGEFGRKIFAPIANELDKIASSSSKFYAESIAGVSQVAPMFKNFVQDHEELSKIQLKLAEDGKRIAEETVAKANPEIEFQKKSEALAAFYLTDTANAQLYADALVAIEQDKNDKISALATQKADLLIGENQRLSAENLFANESEILANQDKLQKILASENLSAKDRTKIQAAYSAQSKEIEKQRGQAVTDSLSALASLQTAKTKEIAIVGKAAAIAQATIDTYRGASAAAAAMAGIPIVGPGLAFAAAAAFIASGVFRVAQIAGVPLAEGLTEVPAGYPNDSFPARLQTGERVVDASTNGDLKSFLSDGGGINRTLQAILARLGALEMRTVVNVGNRTIVDSVREGIRSGRSIDV